MSERHAHEWTRVDGATGIRAWACTECTETSATCGTCGQASGSSLLLCEDCRRHTDRVLDDIAHALSLWEPDPRSPVKSPGNMALIPQPSSSEGGGMSTPDDVEAELLGWVARWTEFTAPENTGWLGFLQGHLIWAAHHPDESDWHAFLGAIRKLRTAARRIAGLLPRFMPEPCAHCGGPVVQDRADHRWNPLTGHLPDTVHCLVCGRAWDDPLLFAFANRQHIVEAPDKNADAWITLDQARMIWPDVPIKTMRSWTARAAERFAWCVARAQDWWDAQPQIGPVSKPPEVLDLLIARHGLGGPRYRLGDLRQFVDTRLDDTRTGPKVESAGQAMSS